MEPVVRHLLDHGRITRGQLGEARRTQQFFGGQLASHLLKLGFVDEEILGNALAEITDTPYASFDKLRAVASEAQQRVPAHLLETHRACPIEIAGQSLRVAMLNPRDAVAIRELERAAGLTIEPWVTTEYRLYQALERYYRIRLDGLRALSLAPPAEMRRRRLREGNETETAARVGTGAAAQDGAEAEVGLDGLPLDAEPDETSLWGGRSPALEELDVPPGDRPLVHAPAPESPPAVEAGSFPRLDTRLATGPDRAEISRAVLDFCSGLAARVALFAAGKDSIRGIAGSGGPFDDRALERVLVPRERSPMLEAALEADEYFYGAVPPDAGSRELYETLDAGVPPTVALFPIRVRDRAVALLYLDNDTQPLPPPDATMVRRLTLKAGLALEILILRNKLRGI